MRRNKIVHGINYKPLQERLLRETSRKPKTLQEILSECKSADFSKDQTKATNALDRQREVNAVNKKKNVVLQKKKLLYSEALLQKNRIYLCKICNLSHSYGKCPDYGTTCKNCGLKNLWEIPCRNKKKQRFPITKNTEGRKVSSLEEENLLSPASPVGLAISNRSESQS
ncbi:hypothetical protein AVEN_38137-1 [Araneus ventricosus]|uniref:Uncharacterized protein n=1 Tax=Araneus ventricosus TaxID=182803 RepID=A0A4Y2SIL2_ARAVE|nr:hypothetical protein AVEN_38137-1 [Araneus ventricosus]